MNLQDSYSSAAEISKISTNGVDQTQFATMRFAEPMIGSLGVSIRAGSSEDDTDDQSIDKNNISPVDEESIAAPSLAANAEESRPICYENNCLR